MSDDELDLVDLILSILHHRKNNGKLVNCYVFFFFLQYDFDLDLTIAVVVHRNGSFRGCSLNVVQREPSYSIIIEFKSLCQTSNFQQGSAMHTMR